MVERIANLASQCIACRRHFEAVHIIDEAIEIAKSFARSESPQQLNDRLSLSFLLEQQMHCLNNLGRTSEGYRIRQSF